MEPDIYVVTWDIKEANMDVHFWRTGVKYITIYANWNYWEVPTLFFAWCRLHYIYPSAPPGETIPSYTKSPHHPCIVSLLHCDQGCSS